MNIDHPIFEKSIRLIKAELGNTGLESLETQVLERLIHTTGDFTIKSLLRFSAGACESALLALKAGAQILTDTTMAASAVIPMANRTLNTKVSCVLQWAPQFCPEDSTRTAIGMKKAWEELSPQKSNSISPIVLIGSSPTALNALLDLIDNGECAPSLIIGMPVGFVGVLESKSRLENSKLSQITISGSRGGAAMAAASINAILRASISSK